MAPGAGSGTPVSRESRHTKEKVKPPCPTRAVPRDHQRSHHESHAPDVAPPTVHPVVRGLRRRRRHGCHEHPARVAGARSARLVRGRRERGHHCPRCRHPHGSRVAGRSRPRWRVHATTFGAGTTEYRRVLTASALTGGVIGVGCYLLRYPLSRGLFFLTFIIGVPLLLLGRNLLRRLIHRLHERGGLLQSVVLGGAQRRSTRWPGCCVASAGWATTSSGPSCRRPTTCP